MKIILGFFIRIFILKTIVRNLYSKLENNLDLVDLIQSDCKVFVTEFIFLITVNLLYWYMNVYCFIRDGFVWLTENLVHLKRKLVA